MKKIEYLIVIMLSLVILSFFYNKGVNFADEGYMLHSAQRLYAGELPYKDFNFIISQTKIIQLNMELALLAGKINNENKKKIKNWGMADSIILATARINKAKVVTGDEHFRNLDSVMIV